MNANALGATGSVGESQTGPGRFLPRALPEMSVSYSRSDLVAVSLIAAVVAVWAAVAGQSFSAQTLLACEAVFFAYYLVGSLVSSIPGVATGVLFDLPLRLLIGYAVVNTLLLALAWLSPLGIVLNFCIVAASAALLALAAKKHKRDTDTAAGLWAVAISALGTTLWCQDSIDPSFEHAGVVVFKPWVDGFYHAVHIRIFAESHGAATIEDFRLSGVPARLYHYGVYMLPAFIKQASDIHSYTAFAGVLAPVGVFFTAISAYAFFGSWWGPWSGLAASVALLLLPDGAQQGMHNTFLSYHWLTQISPSATYGLALLAMAWLFVTRGSALGSRRQLLLGWLMAALLVIYKLHYVIASALLLLLVPALFFQGRLGFRKRAAWALASAAFYAFALWLGQRVPGVPLIRFDGSAVGEILRLVQTFAVPGPLKNFLVQHTGPQFPSTSNLLFGVPYILFAALGLFALLFPLLALGLRRRVSILMLLFPGLLVANFLIMFFGLALDFESSTPDELSHRPVMIVYFFVVAWIGGALGLAVLESRRLGLWTRPAILALATLLFCVPAIFGPGVQLMWAMPKVSPVRLPSSLVRVAEHMRDHGSSADIFQDSQFDRTYAISALAERRAFVSRTMTRMPFRGDMVATRTAAVDRLMAMRDPKLVVGTARAYGLRWFILHRGNRVKWPFELTNQPAFEAGPITLYEF